MGKQVNFYMTPKDEETFLEELRGRGGVTILKARSPTASAIKLDNFPRQGTVESREGVVLWNPEVDSTLVLAPSRDLHFVDKDRSAVIEFSQSVATDEEIRRGRIWAEMTTPEGSDKSDGFRKWYDSVARWIRRNYQRNEDGFYVGPDATKQIERGLKAR